MDFKTQVGLSTGKIKPEFGNLEHIKYLTEAGEREAKLKKGISPDFKSEDFDNDPFSNTLITLSIKCVCGCDVKVDAYGSYDEDYYIFDETDFWCQSCNMDYHCEADMNNDVTVYLGK